MSKINILKTTENDSGWECTVRVTDDNSSTEHLVSVSMSTYIKLTGKQHSPEKLVEKSFEFLLEHEPKESILSEFNIDVIGQYFPKWENEVMRQLAKP